MAIRYTPEELIFLRDSPLVVKPPSLPPAEQWMGPPVDTTRNATRLSNDRTKNHDASSLLDQNRRPAVERHMSRSSANPEDIILGPPKTSFMSSTSIRSTNKSFDSSDRPSLRESDSRDRYSFRGKGEGDHDRLREGRGNNLRPNKRTEGDQDSDGWSTVKPRKSFGTEGAERFNGRMGVDRHREDRRFKDKDEREMKDKPRGFDTFSREMKDHDQDQERDARRNGTGRGRNEATWRDRENNDKDHDLPPTPRDRNSNGDRFMDRNRGWRDKGRDDPAERGAPKNERNERRWDRDRNQREDREPEWLDEPADEKLPAHTQEDFQKWKEQRHLDTNTGSKPAVDDGHFKADAGASFFGLEKQKVETPMSIDTGPDKFFGLWASKEEAGTDSTVDSKKEGAAAKAKTMGKSSRFTSFFAPQEEPPRRQAEPPPPMPAPPLQSGFEGLFQSAGNNNSQSSADKAAFQQLLQKLQQQTISGSGSTPPANSAQQPKPPPLEKAHSNTIASPDPFQHYRPDRQDEGRPATRGSQQPFIQDMLVQRQMAGSQPSIRPEQMVLELVGQRQNALSQASIRPDQPPARNNNTEFLMGLMQSAKAAPEPQRSEQMLLRMPPKSTDRQLQQQMMEREQEMAREAAQRERSASQRRPGPPPGFFDDPSFQRGPPQDRQASGPPQPTQILQRPPPPGLDMGWDRPPQQHRQNLPPPPGLSNAPNRGMPMPQQHQQQMFPPGFQVNNFPPPDAMAAPPRNMMQPPPGMGGFFGGPPPPGFMPPGMGGFQGPELTYGAPFDGRGPPPQGAFRRQ